MAPVVASSQDDAAGIEIIDSNAHAPGDGAVGHDRARRVGSPDAVSPIVCDDAVADPGGRAGAIDSIVQAAPEGAIGQEHKRRVFKLKVRVQAARCPGAILHDAALEHGVCGRRVHIYPSPLARLLDRFIRGENNRAAAGPVRIQCAIDEQADISVCELDGNARFRRERDAAVHEQVRGDGVGKVVARPGAAA